MHASRLKQIAFNRRILKIEIEISGLGQTYLFLRGDFLQ
jgi:hypothetical protein